jgi:succinate-semialdehyde dehydrogenase/glutarate-semialdehyde dehydrogenase
MRNAGQVCTSPTRFFVHESIFDDYADAFVKRAAETVVGDGSVDSVEITPWSDIV